MCVCILSRLENQNAAPSYEIFAAASAQYKQNQYQKELNSYRILFLFHCPFLKHPSLPQLFLPPRISSAATSGGKAATSPRDAKYKCVKTGSSDMSGHPSTT